jgi:hypothetical protein
MFTPEPGFSSLELYRADGHNDSSTRVACARPALGEIETLAFGFVVVPIVNRQMGVTTAVFS